MPTFLIHCLFLLSGISGLVYQVVWVRQFGNVFGNTVYSAATVSAVFLCGLGIGSVVVGRWSDRSFRRDPSAPLRAYGRFEIGIAVFGLAIAWILPTFEPLSASLSAYERGPEGWWEPTTASHLVRYAAAIVTLTPITLLMGGTLTLLIRYLVAREVSVAAWKIGVLYGVNTAGSALGAFLSDFALIPALGILGAQYVAVGLNALAGFAAVGLAARMRAGVGASGPPLAGAESSRASGTQAKTSAPPPVPADDSRRVLYAAIALFVSGVVAMGMEILWFRFLITAIGPYRSVFSLLLTAILIGICLGSLLGGWLHRRYGRAALLYLGAQTLFVLSALAELALFDHEHVSRALVEFQQTYQAASPLGKLFTAFWYNFRTILAVVGIPALLMGSAFPLANAIAQQTEDSVGGRAGSLYLANTLGNVVGSLSMGFVFLPLLGTHHSVWLLAGLATLGLLPLLRIQRLEVRTRSSAHEQRLALACLGALALGVVGWTAVPAARLLRSAVPQASGFDYRVLALREGINETVAVLEAPGRPRLLYTNGHPMSATHPSSQRYMRLFAHIPLLQSEAPKRALVICFGVGNTLHAAWLHRSIEQLEVADLSKNVVEHAHWFAATNGGVRDRERVSIFINDGRHHLRMQDDGAYDLITLEPPPIAAAGVASLYSVEFYELARAKLREGGFMTQWLPAYQVSGEINLSIIRAFVDVFPNAVLLSGHLREFILMGSKGGANQLDLATLKKKLASDPRLARDLTAIRADSLTSLVGTFVAGPETLRRATLAAEPITDDHPLMEYSSVARLMETRLPETIFAVRDVAQWCPTCFEDGRPIPELLQLPDYLAALDTCYRGEPFLTHANVAVSAAAGERDMPLPSSPAEKAAIRDNPYLRYVFLGPEYPDRASARLNTPCAIPHQARAAYRQELAR